MKAPRRGRRVLQLAVAGGGRCDARTARLARALGREIAAAGAVLLCGGLGGVMAAVARGAADAEGTVVGLLPSYEPTSANPHVTLAIPTGLGHARNVLVAAAGDALIALPGEYGTLSEIAFARILGRPVILLGRSPRLDGVVRARTAGEAVRLAVAAATGARVRVGGGVPRRAQSAAFGARRRGARGTSRPTGRA